jgi:hypothetical protein
VPAGRPTPGETVKDGGEGGFRGRPPAKLRNGPITETVEDNENYRHPVVFEAGLILTVADDPHIRFLISRWASISSSSGWFAAGTTFRHPPSFACMLERISLADIRPSGSPSRSLTV